VTFVGEKGQQDNCEVSKNDVATTLYVTGFNSKLFFFTTVIKEQPAMDACTLT